MGRRRKTQRRLLSITPRARPPWATDLVTIYVGKDVLTRMEQERHRQSQFAQPYGVPQPIIALPKATDPMSFKWPVRGRPVRILGTTPRSTMLCLMQALMRDGAVVVAGLDEKGELHLISDRKTVACA